MASSSPSDPAPPPPSPLLLPPPPETAPAPSLVPEDRTKPSPPTVADNVRGLLRSGEAFFRGAFRGNSGHPTPPRPPQHHHHNNRPADLMKRLQRETFPDVMKLMDKHEQIERILSMYRNNSKGFHFPDLPVRVKVAIDAVGALLLVDGDEFERARQVLDRAAGNRTGLGSRFVLESKTKGKDTIGAELSTTRLGAEAGHLGDAAAAGRSLELTRLQYCAHVNDWLSMILVPLGAQCNGFLHGSSLVQNLRSQASSDEPPSFSEIHNCAAGLSIRGSKFTASLAELVFGSGAQDGDHGVENRMTTFGQLCYEPTEDVKLSLSGLWQIRPSLSRFNSLGTLAVPLGSLKPQRRTPPPGSNIMRQGLAAPAPALLAPGAFEGSTVMVHGALTDTVPMPHTAPGPEETRSPQLVAVMVNCKLYETLKAEGWVQMERRPDRGPVRWGMCLSDTPEQELGWGVRMGGTADGEKPHPHLEGFLSFNLGKGGKLQPGLVYVMEEEKRTPALVLRSSWLI